VRIFQPNLCPEFLYVVYRFRIFRSRRSAFSRFEALYDTIAFFAATIPDQLGFSIRSWYHPRRNSLRCYHEPIYVRGSDLIPHATVRRSAELEFSVEFLSS